MHPHYTHVGRELKAARRERWSEYQAFRDSRIGGDPLRLAEENLRMFPDCLPDKFQRNIRRQARNARIAMGQGGVVWRLLQITNRPMLLTAKAKHLRLARDLEHYRLLFNSHGVRTWVRALHEEVAVPMVWTLEVGRARKLHAHAIIAGEDFQGDAHTELLQTQEDVEQVYKYITKELPPDIEVLGAYYDSLWRLPAGERLPQASGRFNIPNNATLKYEELVEDLPFVDEGLDHDLK